MGSLHNVSGAVGAWAPFFTAGGHAHMLVFFKYGYSRVFMLRSQKPTPTKPEIVQLVYISQLACINWRSICLRPSVIPKEWRIPLLKVEEVKARIHSFLVNVKMRAY